jgi:hypothetical protein
MEIKEPIIIIGAPRSGTTLLFSILSSHPDVWSLYGESESIFAKYFHPKVFNWRKGNELGYNDLSDLIGERIRQEFYKRVLNYQVIFTNAPSKIYANRFMEKINKKINQMLIAPIFRPDQIKLVEKTPKNCLRIAFLNAVFPDSFFVFLTRDPRSNISSLMEGWNEPRRYETYRVPGGINIKGYNGVFWNFLLPSEWQEYAKGKTLAEVCAFQYSAANSSALANLSCFPKERWMMVKYEDLISNSRTIVSDICNRIGLSYKGGLKKMAEMMPPVNTSSAPDKEKWKKNEEQVMSVMEAVKEIANSLGYIL